MVARRLGFAALPLAVLTILIGSQAINLLIASASTPSSGIAASLRTAGNVGASVGAATLSPWPDVSWSMWMKSLRNNNTSIGEGLRELTVNGVRSLWWRAGSMDWERMTVVAKWGTLGLAFWMS